MKAEENKGQDRRENGKQCPANTVMTVTPAVGWEVAPQMEQHGRVTIQHEPQF